MQSMRTKTDCLSNFVQQWNKTCDRFLIWQVQSLSRCQGLEICKLQTTQGKLVVCQTVEGLWPEAELSWTYS